MNPCVIRLPGAAALFIMAGMDVCEPLGGTTLESQSEAPGAPAFDLRRAGPEGAAPPTPLVFASPHSGRCYPADLMAASRLSAVDIRRSEDAFVDELVGQAPALGAALISARLARAYVDLNRDPTELDPAMFADQLPDSARVRTARVAAGLGAIARVVADGQEIYARKLNYAEARERIDSVHRPYHLALQGLLSEAQAAHGFAVLIDWHSMPMAAARASGRAGASDIVLGDRFGAACAGTLTRRVEQILESMGYSVARNAPYAGGFTTEHYGTPARRIHALQIEINRGLYLDETSLTPTDGFARLKSDLETLTQRLADSDWPALV